MLDIMAWAAIVIWVFIAAAQGSSRAAWAVGGLHAGNYGHLGTRDLGVHRTGASADQIEKGAIK